MLRRVSLMTSRANELANPIGQYGEPEPPQQPELRELLLQQAGTPRVAYMPQHVYIFTPCREPWPAASINARLVRYRCWSAANTSCCPPRLDLADFSSGCKHVFWCIISGLVLKLTIN
jgi:hypothetical protein